MCWQKLGKLPVLRVDRDANKCLQPEGSEGKKGRGPSSKDRIIGQGLNVQETIG